VYNVTYMVVCIVHASLKPRDCDRDRADVARNAGVGVGMSATLSDGEEWVLVESIRMRLVRKHLRSGWMGLQGGTAI
jgi:hypothetical protein